MDGIIVTTSFKGLFESIKQIQYFNRVRACFKPNTGPLDDTLCLEYESVLLPSEVNTETLYEGLTHALSDIRHHLNQNSDPVGHVDESLNTVDEAIQELSGSGKSITHGLGPVESIGQDLVLTADAEGQSGPVEVVEQDVGIFEDGEQYPTGIENVEEESVKQTVENFDGTQKNGEEGSVKMFAEADKEILEVNVPECPHPVENAEETAGEVIVENTCQQSPIELPSTKECETPVASHSSEVTHIHSPVAQARPTQLDQNTTEPEHHIVAHQEFPSPERSGEHNAKESIDSTNTTLVNETPEKVDRTSDDLSSVRPGHSGLDVTAGAQLTSQHADAAEPVPSPEGSVSSGRAIGSQEGEGHSSDGEGQEQGDSDKGVMTLECHELLMECEASEHENRITALKEEHEDTVKALQEKLDSLASHKRCLMKRVKKEVESGKAAEQTIRNLQAEVEKLASELQQVKLELTARDETVVQLQGHINGAVQHEIQLHNQMQTMESEFKYTREQLRRMINEYERVYRQYEAAKKLSELVPTQRALRADIERLAASRGQEIEELQREVTACRAEHAVLKNAHDYVMEENQHLAQENARTEKEKARSTIAELQKNGEQKDELLRQATKEKELMRDKAAELKKEVSEARSEALPLKEELDSVASARDAMAQKLEATAQVANDATKEKMALESRYCSLLKAAFERKGINPDLSKRLEAELGDLEDERKRLRSELAETKQRLEQSDKEKQVAKRHCKFLEEKVALEVADRTKLMDTNIRLECDIWERIVRQEAEERKCQNLQAALMATHTEKEKFRELLNNKQDELIRLCLDRTQDGEIIAEHYQVLVRYGTTVSDKLQITTKYLDLEKEQRLREKAEFMEHQLLADQLQEIDEDLRQRLATAEGGWAKYRELKDQLREDREILAAREKSAAKLPKTVRAGGRDVRDRSRQLELGSSELGSDESEEEVEEGPEEEGEEEDDGTIPKSRRELSRRYRLLYDDNGRLFLQNKDLSAKAMEYRARLEELQRQVASLEAAQPAEVEPTPAEPDLKAQAEVEAKIQGLTSELEAASQRVRELEGYVAGGVGAQAQAAFSEMEKENKALKKRYRALENIVMGRVRRELGAGKGKGAGAEPKKE